MQQCSTHQKQENRTNNKNRTSNTLHPAQPRQDLRVGTREWFGSATGQPALSCYRGVLDPSAYTTSGSRRVIIPLKVLFEIKRFRQKFISIQIRPSSLEDLLPKFVKVEKLTPFRRCMRQDRLSEMSVQSPCCASNPPSARLSEEPAASSSPFGFGVSESQSYVSGPHHTFVLFFYVWKNYL